MIREWHKADIDWILALNATAEAETSPLERDELAAMLARSSLSLVAEPDLGFIIVFDQQSDDDGGNYRWFKDRYSHFAYVDRIIIDAKTRGQGIGKQLYGRLFEAARQASYPFVGCEINIKPANPKSIAFHEGLGFTAIEDRVLSPQKTVRYFQRPLR